MGKRKGNVKSKKPKDAATVKKPQKQAAGRRKA